MTGFRRWLFALPLVTPLLSPAQDPTTPASPAVTEERHDDHEALRALMKKAVEALNTRNFDAIAPSLHKNFTIVTVDNRKFTGLDEFKYLLEQPVHRPARCCSRRSKRDRRPMS